MSAIDEIQSLLAPPVLSTSVADVVWEPIEKELGVSFPTIYKRVIEIYSIGSISSFLWFLSPFSQNPNFGLGQMLWYHSAYSQMKSLFPKTYFRPPFPEKGSFLTWAGTDNGDSIFWEIGNSSADNWLVGIASKDQGDEELTGLSTEAFLLALLKGNFQSNILPKRFLKEEKYFNSV